MVIANLELVPLRMSVGKEAVADEPQRALAKQLNEKGLLSKGGLKAVEAVAKKGRGGQETGARSQVSAGSGDRRWALRIADCRVWKARDSGQ